MAQTARELGEQLYGKTEPGHCVRCKKKFGNDNTFSRAGWKETEISALCEVCYDTIADKIKLANELAERKGEA